MRDESPRAPLQVLLVTPAAARSRSGNRVTALRVAGLLRSLGHRVRVRDRDDGKPADVLIALHARKSSGAVADFTQRSPHVPVVLMLTGTDVYPAFDAHPDAVAAAERAARLVVLQPLAADALPAPWRTKTRVVVQCATAPPAVPRAVDTFDVCVLAHLRPVKDPLLAARAVAMLPPHVPVRVRHAGAAIDPELAAQARAFADRRYDWLGPLPRRQARHLLAGSALLVVTSHNEGGANVLSEAIAAGVPVLATRMPGNTGLLGDDYPGLFPVGDARALAALLQRAATEPPFLGALALRCARLKPMFAPARERSAWARLLAELFPGTIAPPCDRSRTP